MYDDAQGNDAYEAVDFDPNGISAVYSEANIDNSANALYHGLGNTGNANAQLYSIPMEAESDGAGDGTIGLPRGRSGTVVAAAASGAYEVVAATDGIYAHGDASAAGVRVMGAAESSRYNTANHSNTGSHGNASAAGVRVMGAAESSRYNTANHSNTGSRSEKSGTTTSVASTPYDAGGGVRGKGDDGSGTIGSVSSATSTYSRLSKPTLRAGHSGTGSRTGTGVSRGSKARASGNYGFEGGGGGTQSIARGRNQGVSVYNGFEEEAEV